MSGSYSTIYTSDSRSRSSSRKDKAKGKSKASKSSPKKSKGTAARDPRSLPSTSGPKGSDFADFVTVGDARFDADDKGHDTLVLTRMEPKRISAAWIKSRVAAKKGFDVAFTFKITTPAKQAPCDGFAFVYQNSASGSAALGAGGCGIGYEGIEKSLAIEFDTFMNGTEGEYARHDPSGKHISVHTRGTKANSADHSASIAIQQKGFKLADAKLHAVRIQYDKGLFKLWFDSDRVPLMEWTYDLEKNISKEGYIGFTSSTGIFELCSRHELFHFTTKPKDNWHEMGKPPKPKPKPGLYGSKKKESKKGKGSKGSKTGSAGSRAAKVSKASKASKAAKTSSGSKAGKATKAAKAPKAAKKCSTSYDGYGSGPGRTPRAPARAKAPTSSRPAAARRASYSSYSYSPRGPAKKASPAPVRAARRGSSSSFS